MLNKPAPEKWWIVVPVMALPDEPALATERGGNARGCSQRDSPAFAYRNKVTN
jgi:hypothetical protein